MITLKICVTEYEKSKLLKQYVGISDYPIQVTLKNTACLT